MPEVTPAAPPPQDEFDDFLPGAWLQGLPEASWFVLLRAIILYRV